MAVADSSLTAIQNKVRMLTRSPSLSQLTNAQLNQYINTFVLYDFPEHLRTFNLLTTFTFYTNIGQDAYPTDTASYGTAVNNPLYDFQNIYLSMDRPVYIAGFESQFFESREQFYGIYPFVNNIASIGVTGNGTPGPFIGYVNTQQSIINPTVFQQQASLLQNNVLFSAIGSPAAGENISMSLVDVPLTDPNTGYKLNIGNLFDPNSAAYQNALVNPTNVILDPNNFINYQTGQFSIAFSGNTIAGTPINSQTVLQVQALPQALLYYNNIFYVRPIPDQSYAVNFQAYIRPTELLQSNQNPNLNEWWQYIAYGAAKKVFEDRMDLESVQLIMPEFKQQERLCLRRTIVQQTSQRSSTIYSEQTSTAGAYGPGWWAGGGTQ